jgi:hypothetical protein
VITREQLDQLDQLRAAATPGPWTALPVDPVERWLEEDDEDLIVAAMNALPQLTAALRAVEALAENGAWSDGTIHVTDLRTALATVVDS